MFYSILMVISCLKGFLGNDYSITEIQDTLLNGHRSSSFHSKIGD